MRLIFLSSYAPRHCGIAEFTQDCITALQKFDPSLDIRVMAIDDRKDGYVYEKPVMDHFFQEDKEAYHIVAKKINDSGADCCILEYEPNLFGGIYNEYILEFVHALRIPLLVVLHSIPTNPEHRKFIVRREQLQKMAPSVSCFIAIVPRVKNELLDLGISHEKIIIIGHGAPIMPSLNASELKKLFGIEKRFVVMIFGLLRPSKNIEVLIEAIAKIRERVPNVLALIIGQGDVHDTTGYIATIQKLAHDRQCDEHVRFMTTYLSQEVLCQYLVASDVVVTPYGGGHQISSGVLTFAVGAGTPIITTPYIYAKEFLHGCDVFMPFGDANALAKRLERMATDLKFFQEQQKIVRTIAPTISWNVCAKKYYECIQRIVGTKFSATL